MAPPLFGPTDVAALVTAFPPSVPSIARPALVRSRSGDNLLDSRKVVARFRTLLETAPSRIKLADLPSRLGIQANQWLLTLYEEPLYYSYDGQSLVPQPAVDAVVSDITTRLRQAVLYVETLCRELDVLQQSMLHLLADRASLSDIQEMTEPGTGGKPCLYSRTFASQIADAAQAAVAGEQSGSVNLTESFPDVAPALLCTFANDALTGPDAESGTFHVVDDRIAFVSSSSPAHEEEQQREAQATQVQALVATLRKDGLCHIPARTERDAEVLKAVKAHHDEQAGVGACVIELSIGDAGTTALVQSGPLEQALVAVKMSAPDETAKMWRERQAGSSAASFLATLIESLDSQASSKITSALLQSSLRQQIDSIVTETITRLESEDHERFTQAVREQLLTPATLYATGIATVDDPTLKQHLEEFLGDHFRRELIPTLAHSLREHKLLFDKSRRRDFEKMLQVCADAKALSDILNAATRLARKQKMTFADADALAQTKSLMLLQRAKAMRKFPRGSDVLQNLIWILLATESEGLFMSPGKDTSRMMVQYQRIGDAEVGRKLGLWRDMLKAGQEQVEDLREMREVAAAAVARGCGSQGE
ncbi:hypothetical protein LTR08_000470 [Meristemomyces frigidus]|nr:hypothetical protein LTR08_000470 [Meristemomyces frigidus]